MKITGKIKYETGRGCLLKVFRKKGTLTPIKMMYKEINILSTVNGEKKCNNGYAKKVKPRLGIALN
ncbi:MAG: hypothetical protein A2Y97_13225 [Nitrospirae bacterium RBG_13_39_12]|nr:MAG: hypothetical protein A2Y97_13225 [Nitrospirae bacterium RBG_13_39_12]